MNLVAGTFKAKGVKGGLGETKNGSPQVAVLLEVKDGDYAGEAITWYGYFTEKTQERTLESLRILGWKTDDLSDLTGIDENEVHIVLKDEEYNGETTLKVAYINRRGDLALQSPMSPDKAKVFAASMKAAAVLSRGATAAPRKPAQPGQRPAQGQPAQRSNVGGAGQSQARKPTSQTPPDDFNYDNGGGDDIPF